MKPKFANFKFYAPWPFQRIRLQQQNIASWPFQRIRLQQQNILNKAIFDGVFG